MAKVGTLDARLARLQEADSQGEGGEQRGEAQEAGPPFADNEKRRVWIVGTCAMAAMGERRMRELIARELRKEGVLRKDGDAELFADLLAAGYIPTAEENEVRQAMDEPANQDGADAVPVAAE